MKKVILILFLPLLIFAQDSHYWNIFSGNLSSLLGASSIAGIDDFSTAFYNPGYLGKVSPNFSLNGNIFSFQENKAYNAAGANNNTYSSSFGILPNMTAGPVPVQLDKKGRLGYVIFQKSYASNDYSFIKQEFRDLIPSFEINNHTIYEGDEFYSGEFELNKDLTEYWAGISWGRYENGFGFGISFFAAIRNQQNFFQLNSLAADLQNDVAVTTNLRYKLDMFDVRLLAKVGAVYENEDLRLGLTFTTPSVHFYSDASLGGYISSTGLYYRDDEDNLHGPHDFVATNTEKNLSTNYRSPFSIGFALLKKINGFKFGFGAEYFSSISLNTVISPKDAEFVITNPSGEELPVNGKLAVLTTYQEASKVFNYGFFVERELTKKLAMYFNFRTDFSASKKHGEEFVYVNNDMWNFYHLTLGAIYKTRKISVGIAAQYSLSRDKNISSLTNLNSNGINSDDFFLINNDNTEMNLVYNRLLISVGITYFLEPLF